MFNFEGNKDREVARVRPHDRQKPLQTIFSWLPVSLAAAWLVASLVAGLHVMNMPFDVTAGQGGSAPQLTARSMRSAYGGDAYTGIQNAASDTEHAVVAGTNEMAAVTVSLAEKNRALSVQVAQRQWDSWTFSLGFLIISAGVGPLLVLLARRLDTSGTAARETYEFEYPLLPSTAVSGRGVPAPQ